MGSSPEAGCCEEAHGASGDLGASALSIGEGAGEVRSGECWAGSLIVAVGCLPPMEPRLVLRLTAYAGTASWADVPPASGNECLRRA